MKRLLVGLAALPFLTTVALAGQPTQLSDAQMDRVTAGNFVVSPQNPSFTVSLDNPYTVYEVTTSPPITVIPVVTCCVPTVSVSAPSVTLAILPGVSAG
jgi:hypothetical protein